MFSSSLKNHSPVFFNILGITYSEEFWNLLLTRHIKIIKTLFTPTFLSVSLNPLNAKGFAMKKDYVVVSLFVLFLTLGKLWSKYSRSYFELDHKFFFFLTLLFLVICQDVDQTNQISGDRSNVNSTGLEVSMYYVCSEIIGKIFSNIYWIYLQVWRGRIVKISASNAIRNKTNCSKCKNNSTNNGNVIHPADFFFYFIIAFRGFLLSLFSNFNCIIRHNFFTFLNNICRFNNSTLMGWFFYISNVVF